MKLLVSGSSTSIYHTKKNKCTKQQKNLLEHDVFSIDSIMHSLNILILNETQLFS